MALEFVSNRFRCKLVSQAYAELAGPTDATEADLIAALTANPELRQRVLEQLKQPEESGATEPPAAEPGRTVGTVLCKNCFHPAHEGDCPKEESHWMKRLREEYPDQPAVEPGGGGAERVTKDMALRAAFSLGGGWGCEETWAIRSYVEQSEREVLRLKAALERAQVDRSSVVEVGQSFRAKLIEAQRENESLRARVQEEDARAVAWMDTADQRLRERDALKAERDGLLIRVAIADRLSAQIVGYIDAGGRIPEAVARYCEEYDRSVAPQQSPTSASPAKRFCHIPGCDEMHANEGMMCDKHSPAKLGGADRPVMLSELVAALGRLTENRHPSGRLIGVGEFATRLIAELERGGKTS